MGGFIENIVEKAKNNTDFRRVLATGMHTQVVIMSIPVNEEIGEEVHEEADQVLYLLKGEGEAVIKDESKPFREGDLILVNAGTKHNFINKGSIELKIITTYSPPHHPKGTVHKTKAESLLAGY